MQKFAFLEAAYIVTFSFLFIKDAKIQKVSDNCRCLRESAREIAFVRDGDLQNWPV
jgi:hypothetical protein